MVKRTIESLFLPGPAGQLEAQLESPVEPRTDWVGLVCHPHPLHGGTMRNKVVHHAARVLREQGLAVLRFNFRGAGLSEGVHDQGRGEADDVRAALDYLATDFPQARVCLAGFSFGAWVGLRVGCRDPRVGLLVGIGLPADSTDFSYLKRCPKPKLFVQGTRDQYGSPAAVSAAVSAAAEPKELRWVEGADHFFSGQLEKLRAVLAPWLAGALERKREATDAHE
ncbi:MAG: alpha/beta hydrolase [Acidobacteria bacterium]|nr:alpha/beta hydrolase [Acidobacteriota bacterium]